MLIVTTTDLLFLLKTALRFQFIPTENLIFTLTTELEIVEEMSPSILVLIIAPMLNMMIMVR
jgi:hypothetical protein